MGVCIKGMEMPKSCHKCFIKQGSCPAIRKRIQVLPANNHIWVPHNYRYDDCPLGNVPTPHGGLIDAHSLKIFFANLYDIGGAQADDKVFDLLGIYKWIDRFAETSTIIEAEEGND